MASGSPRTRIDQFYASKKRKNLSPAIKLGGVDKEEKRTARASPSGKGTLDSYLRCSQGNDLAGEGLLSTRELSSREDSVKRNLVEEIDKSERLESTSLQLLSQEHHHHAVEAAHKPPSPRQLHVSMGECPAEVRVSAESGNGNSELKQFANDFLSLYCSEIQSNIPSGLKTCQKRHGSPSISNEETLKSNKRHQKISNTQLNDATTSGKGKNVKEMSPTSSSNCIRQVSAVKDPIGPEEVSKRCSETPISIRNATGGFTPGSSIVKSLANITPRSACGSSMFSPGEAFWSEAIKLADGISAHANKSVCQDVELFSSLQKSCDLGVLNDLSKKDGEAIREGVLEGQSSICIRENDAAEGVERHNEHLDERVSQLPVKHFDFSCEDKNVDEVTPHSCDADNAKDVTYGYLKHDDLGSVGLKGVRTTNILAPCGQAQKTEGKGKKEKMVIVHATTKQKADLLSQKFDSSASDSPISEVKSFIAKKDVDDSLTPSTSLKYRDCLDITSWLPPEICHVYMSKGISKLYPWQVDCLQVDGVLQRKNLVYCASTSAGKSFVAEILMLRRVLLTAKIALLVLPYVSICTEKAEHLEVLLQPLGKHVRSYYGNQGGGAPPKDTSVAVCTIEKANSLINRLLEEGRLSEIGIIVIDELHMVGDQSRGYLLELMLTKLRYAAGEGNSESSSGDSSSASSGKADIAHGLQIVGMSATMPNVAAVADWLQAALYQTDFRPVPLEEYIKVGSTIYNKSMQIVRSIPKAADLGGKDPDHIVELCNEVVQEGHSILIFCSSRKGCESTARHVSRFLKNFSVNLSNNDSEFTDIALAIDALRRCPAGLDPILEETLPFGVAYHHAGLTVEEREVVESCYRKGLVRVLTATSTLAAGVNLPARRVIFRQPRIGRDFIDGTRYKQMAGRAGRTGIDTKGESILICRPEEIKRIVGLLNENCPPLSSCLSEDKNGMAHAILEVVAGGMVQTAQDINRYVRCTLLNSTKPFQDVVKSAQDSLRWLCHRRFLEWNEDTKLYSTTPLGRAAFGSSLSPEESLIVLEDLSRAREGFVLASDLHLVYLVTPTNVDVEPDWELYYQRFMELSSLDQSVGNRVGVSEPFLMRMAHGAPIHSCRRTGNSEKGLHVKFQKYSGITNNCSISDDQTLRVCKRFYVALILSRLVQEIPVVEVCEAFKVSRGMVQSLQENAGRFASMVSVFCERLGWSDLEGLVSKFQNRVSFGVRAEIVELTNIPYVKGSRARALYKAGLRTPLAIAEASISELVKSLFESSSWAAEESSAQRRIQLGVAKKIKNGARKIVLEKAEAARLAAFSAFQSLGLDITHFSRSVQPNDVVNPTIKGNTEISSEEGSTPSSNGAKILEHVSTGALIEASTGYNVMEGEDEKVRKALVGGSLPSDAANTSAVATHDVGDRRIELNWSTVHKENEGMAPVSLLHKSDDGNKIADGYHDNDSQIHLTENVHSQNKERGLNKGPVYSVNTSGGFDSFLDLWDSVEEFYFDIHYNKRRQGNTVALYEMHGLAICWGNSPVYYINLPKDLFWREKKKNSFLSGGASSDASYDFPLVDMFKLRWNRIGEIMAKSAVRKFTWNLKCQVQVFRNSTASLQKTGCPNLAGKNTGIELVDNSYLMLPPIDIKGGVDMSIVAWILWPDEERSSHPNLEKEVKKRLSREDAAAAHRCGMWKNQMRKAAHDGCCRRVAQTRALCSVLWKLLIHESLLEALMTIELPLVNVLADMELWGIGVDMEGCLEARTLLGKKLRHLEKEAYSLAGMKFSLYTAADIANVLYGHLKLPIPEMRGKGKQHPSTDKHCLDLLRNEHPIIPVIKEHRTLAKLLNSTLGSICSLGKLSLRTQKYTLHGHWLQTSTATGRLSMEEPNLQCVEHMIEFKIDEEHNGGDTGDNQYKIKARDFIVPTEENWLILTADYSQIELRLMAHFSEDSTLIGLLSKPDGDVFMMIAAKWTGKAEHLISPHERDQTKRMIYGILYGMGAKTLAEQLGCSKEEASEKIKSFKGCFPRVASWLRGAVSYCQQKGYVETLKGRKRFLSKIKFGNDEEKLKAQRQAVNSICQGSAADIIKIAMINIHSVIVGRETESDLPFSDFQMLKGRCRILLQVHDELVLEVDPLVTKEAAQLLRMSMENAVSLRVPLRIKLEVGRTWGTTEPFHVENFKKK